MDKLSKVRAEVEKLNAQLLRGACASQVAMETRCKEEAYNEVLAILDTMQEEPTSWLEEFKAKVDSMSKEDFKKIFDKYTIDFEEEPVCKDLEEAAITAANEDMQGRQIMEESNENRQLYSRIFRRGFKAGTEWQREKDESTTEDLGEYINELSKQFPEVSFAKLSRIAVRVAKWQKLQDMGITNKAQDVVDNILSSADSPLDAYATEVAFMMLPATLKESYHQTNRDRIGDAIRLGANWKEQQMMAKAIDAELCSDGMFTPLISVNDKEKISDIKFGDKVKVILLKK